MKYCTLCLVPDTKPHATFNSDGVCSACLRHKTKRDPGKIDWAGREKQFEKIVLSAKAEGAPFYDVLVPVSGGKDSITQVHRLLKFGLRILAVNVDYGIKTEIGRYNLSIIPEMGASLVIYRPKQSVHKELMRIGFEDFGDPDLLSHTLLHAYPLHVALQFRIPLVLLGENSAFEYGGDEKIAEKESMTKEWFLKYAANNGRDAKYISKKYGIPYEKLKLYDFPAGIEKSGTKTIFMSRYFYWDSEAHLEIARGYGFKTLGRNREGTYRSYVGLDEKINRVHQYMKVLKFGYGRATDHACEDIRNGRMTREEAKHLIKKYDMQGLSDYYVTDFIWYLGYTEEKFYSILEKFRNKYIWKKDKKGAWYIRGYLEDKVCG